MSDCIINTISRHNTDSGNKSPLLISITPANMSISPDSLTYPISIPEEYTHWSRLSVDCAVTQYARMPTNYRIGESAACCYATSGPTAYLSICYNEIVFGPCASTLWGYYYGTYIVYHESSNIVVDISD